MNLRWGTNSWELDQGNTVNGDLIRTTIRNFVIVSNEFIHFNSHYCFIVFDVAFFILTAPKTETYN